MLNQLSAADLRALHVFEAVAEAGSYAAAQELLGIGPSTISIQISDLEARLGYRLCERGRGGFGLTARGKVVLEAYADLRSSMNGFRDRVNTLLNSAVGTLRLGLIDHTVTEPGLSIVEVMRRFSEAAPQARIEIVQGIQSDLRTAVLEDRIDLAIGAFGRQSEAIVARPLYTERQSIYCGARHPFFERAPDRVPRSELEAADWVQRGYSLGPSVSLPVEVAYSSATAANIEGVVMIILAGRHIGIVPDHFAQPFEERGALRRISPTTLSVGIVFSLISRKGRRDTGAMQGFRQALEQVVRESAPR